ncbi:MAG: sigma-54 dependent transcriptional regulator [Candidatus Cloacimonetes bacterium]|nr:sigma-54 dependent transcriptional regulator [Candidatus Cloacimonadota bacterium]
MEEKPRILIVDDEEDTRILFKRHLEDTYDVNTAESAELALQMLESNEYHIVMTDLVMPKVNGLQLLQQIKKLYPHLAVVVISGKASVKMAVQAMKEGAEDFIEKPVEDLEIINFIINKVMKIHWQTEEITRLKEQLATDFERKKIVGNSMIIQKLLEKVKMIAPLDTTVMVSGETGVGKEVFAELIWQNSKRKDKRFVAVNCGSLPETLLESALFGHKKGAFTDAVRDKIGFFQEANGGTLFLDEITETSPAFQIKLLRVLEKGMVRQVGGDTDIPVNVRVITASNKDIENEVTNGNFREDLYYRLNVIKLHIPPLRERQEDIPYLAQEFLTDLAERHHKAIKSISEPALSLLVNHSWKGNVRELKNAMEHAVVLATHNLILPKDLPSTIYDSQKFEDHQIDIKFLQLRFQEAKELFEKEYINHLLKRSKGDVTNAAEISGIKRQNLYEKFSKYDIDPNKFRK